MCKVWKENIKLHGRGNLSRQTNHDYLDAVCNSKRLIGSLEEPFGIWAVSYIANEAVGQGHPRGIAAEDDLCQGGDTKNEWQESLKKQKAAEINSPAEREAKRGHETNDPNILHHLSPHWIYWDDLR